MSNKKTKDSHTEDREWIALVPTRGESILLITAPSRKEAEAILRDRVNNMEKVQYIDHNSHSDGIGRIVCEDKLRPNK